MSGLSCVLSDGRGVFGRGVGDCRVPVGPPGHSAGSYAERRQPLAVHAQQPRDLDNDVRIPESFQLRADEVIE